MICLRAFAHRATQLRDHPLPLTAAGDCCALHLCNLPGADALHLLFSQAEQPLLRVEIPAHSRERLWLKLRLDDAGRLGIEDAGRPLLRLPLAPAAPPLPPIDLSGPRPALDLVIVVDGTCRVLPPPQTAAPAPPLLEAAEPWAAHVDKLCRFTARLQQDYADCRLGLLAFGDQPVPRTTAPDLCQPRYRLHFPPMLPGGGRLAALSLEQLRQGLLSLPATAGGDFVDALADALAAGCELPWRPEARKLLLVTGDSPGHSLLHPLPGGADACLRDHDVDTQARRLHRLGVERVMIYQHDWETVEADNLLDVQRRLLRGAADQYQRLAALPEYAFTAAGFAGEPEADWLQQQTGLIGHAGAYAELLEIAPPVAAAEPQNPEAAA